MKRLEAVKESISKVREDRRSLPEDAAVSYSLMRSTPILMSQMRLVGRLVPPLFNLHISNTAGAVKPRYFRGARLEDICTHHDDRQVGAPRSGEANVSDAIMSGWWDQYEPPPLPE